MKDKPLEEEMNNRIDSFKNDIYPKHKIAKVAAEEDWETKFDCQFKDIQFGPSNYTHYFNEASIYSKIKSFIREQLMIKGLQDFHLALEEKQKSFIEGEREGMKEAIRSVEGFETYCDCGDNQRGIIELLERKLKSLDNL